MTVTDIITRCDRLKPNEYPQGQKREWLNSIESDIRQYASQYSDKCDMSFVSEENPVLYLDKEHSDIYIYYLISMIDLNNQEYQLYNNSAAYFNSVFSAWKKKHRRKNMPQCNISIRV